jgi:hypothetical protein
MLVINLGLSHDNSLCAFLRLLFFHFKKCFAFFSRENVSRILQNQIGQIFYFKITKSYGLAVNGLKLSARDFALEQDAKKLYSVSVLVSVTKVFATKDAKNARWTNAQSRLFPNLSRDCLCWRFAGVNPASGQTPTPIVRAFDEKNSSFSVFDNSSNARNKQKFIPHFVAQVF